MEKEAVCYTREAGLAKAIEMETRSFETLKKAFFTVKNRRTLEMVKEIALDELDHKYTLEKAFFEETVALHEAGMAEGPSMELSIMLEEKELDASATDQDVMIYAIHNKKRIVDFYQNMALQCGGAPMEGMFKKLHEAEKSHLIGLEELYESIYMQHM